MGDFSLDQIWKQLNNLEWLTNSRACLAWFPRCNEGIQLFPMIPPRSKPDISCLTLADDFCQSEPHWIRDTIIVSASWLLLQLSIEWVKRCVLPRPKLEIKRHDLSLNEISVTLLASSVRFKLGYRAFSRYRLALRQIFPHSEASTTWTCCVVFLSVNNSRKGFHAERMSESERWDKERQ